MQLTSDAADTTHVDCGVDWRSRFQKKRSDGGAISAGAKYGGFEAADGINTGVLAVAVG